MNGSSFWPRDPFKRDISVSGILKFYDSEDPYYYGVTGQVQWSSEDHIIMCKRKFWNSKDLVSH